MEGREQISPREVILHCVWVCVHVCVISSPNYGLVKGDEGKQEDILREKGNLCYFRQQDLSNYFLS